MPEEEVDAKEHGGTEHPGEATQEQGLEDDASSPALGGAHAHMDSKQDSEGAAGEQGRGQDQVDLEVGEDLGHGDRVREDEASHHRDTAGKGPDR